MHEPRQPTIPDRNPAAAHTPEMIQLLRRWQADVQRGAPADMTTYADDRYQVVAAPVRFALHSTGAPHDRPAAQGVIFGSGDVVLCCFTGTGSHGVEVSLHRSFWEAIIGLEHLWITWLDTPPAWLQG